MNMKNLLADINLAPDSGFSGPGTIGENPSVNPGARFDQVISTTIGVLTSIAFIYFVINFLIAGLSWITAGSDAKQVEAARGKLTNNLIGLIIVIAAIFLTEFIGNIFNIPILSPTSILGIN